MAIRTGGVRVLALSAGWVSSLQKACQTDHAWFWSSAPINARSRNDIPGLSVSPGMLWLCETFRPERTCSFEWAARERRSEVIFGWTYSCSCADDSVSGSGAYEDCPIVKSWATFQRVRFAVKKSSQERGPTFRHIQYNPIVEVCHTHCLQQQQALPGRSFSCEDLLQGQGPQSFTARPVIDLLNTSSQGHGLFTDQCCWPSKHVPVLRRLEGFGFSQLVK